MKINKSIIPVLLITAITFLWQSPAYAQLWRVNEAMTVRFAPGAMTINRSAHLQERQSNSVLRDHDLMRNIKNIIDNIRFSTRVLKERQLDRIRGSELSRLLMSNTKDLIERNKTAQQSQRQIHRDRMRTLRSQSRDLMQRVKDMSRR